MPQSDPPLPYAWLAPEHQTFAELFHASSAYVERRTEGANPVLEAIAQTPNSGRLQKEYAQYFTPPDVALYTAYQLLKSWQPGLVCYDPAMGKAGLLIACGVTLALTRGLRNGALLAALGGGELCPATYEAGVANLAAALAPWLPALSPDQATTTLRQQLRCGDFFEQPLPAGALVITNPPYQESRTGNLWLQFAERLLGTPSLAGLALIVPVSLCCAKRTLPIRQSLMRRFNQLVALHHEIRPKPLFPKVEQRISILIATPGRGQAPHYSTTGFLTHRAGERASVWAQPFTSLPYAAVQTSFPKLTPADLPFFWAQQTAPQRLAAFKAERFEAPLWVRSTGRYQLFAQRTSPTEPSTKWHSVQLSEAGQALVLAAFADGTALRWWRIFGDGRDLSIQQFVQRFGVACRNENKPQAERNFACI